jgi:hypothetical protein
VYRGFDCGKTDFANGGGAQSAADDPTANLQRGIVQFEKWKAL